MVGYGPPIFYGRPGEDPEDWLRDMQRYIIASRINVAPGAGQAAGREEAFGLVVSCLAGDALNWYNTRVKGKNWRCNNLSDNLGVADLNAVRVLGAGNGGNQIGGLNPMNQYNIRMMAKFYDTQDNITKALAEAEKYTLSQMNAPSSIPVFPAANPYVDTNRSGGGMTKNEIEDLIKITMASSQS